MVLVLVGQEDRQHLHPEIRASVNQHLEPLIFDEGGRPEPFVVRIRRLAHGTPASDDRNPLGGPRPQEREFYFTHNTMSSNWFTSAGS